MKEIDLAYFPIIGRGEQINIICAIHGIKVNNLNNIILFYPYKFIQYLIFDCFKP